MEALKPPGPCGLKFARRLQLALTARVVEQLLALSTKSPGKSPVRTIPLMLSVAVPVLVRTIVWDALSVPAGVLGNDKLFPEKLATGAVAVPLTPAVCVPATVFSVTVRVFVNVPVELGAKATTMAQLPPGATAEKQVVPL
jgi:hypothetical protein